LAIARGEEVLPPASKTVASDAASINETVADETMSDSPAVTSDEVPATTEN
jgi:hypothetical protein